MSNTFCPIPWIFQAARSNGDLRICCQANVTPNRGVLRKIDGNVYNARSADLVESRNSFLMKEVRKNMLNGIWSEECGRCHTEEVNGLSSRRNYELDNWNYRITDAMLVTAADGTLDTDASPVRYYDFRFGNLCNLKCRMCGPTDSNSWYEDWVKITDNNTFSETSGKVEISFINGKYSTGDEYTWYESQTFWMQLEKMLPWAEHIYFAGGEPLLIQQHYDFLEKCVEYGYSKNIILEYNTNGTTLPPRLLTLWESFKEVRLGVSVDGIEEMLEYQRYPASWEKVLNNLYKLDATPSNIIVRLTCTITAYNIFHFIYFIKWRLHQSKFKKINKSKKNPIITYHIAHYPKHLNIRVLPDTMKEQARYEYNNLLESILEDSSNSEYVKDHAKRIVYSVLKYLDSQSYYNEHWTEFCKFTSDLDRIRGQSLIEVEPRFKGFI